jgi:antitoxin component of MazEF toxin-antitoxin module
MAVTTYLTRKVVKQGGSMAIHLPRPCTHAIGIEVGDEVRVYVVGHVICVQRAPKTDFAPGVIAVNLPPRITFADEEGGNNASHS